MYCKAVNPELLSSTLAVAEKLGIEITILEEASCVGLVTFKI